MNSYALMDRGVWNFFRGLGIAFLYMACALSLHGCGGGGELEAVVSVTDGYVLEGNDGITTMEFEVRLNKPAIGSIVVTYNTRSGTGAGNRSMPELGLAVGGSCKGSGNDSTEVDFVSVPLRSVTIKPGETLAKLEVIVCSDRQFEPKETFGLDWTVSGVYGGSVIGTIINDDVGGLNGTGATNLLASGSNGSAFKGRDTLSLTNGSDDGPLGFSFEKTPLGDCTRDKVTGLVWQPLKDGAWPSVAYAGLESERSTAVQGGLCGQMDWRVPTVNELMSLMNFGVTTGQAMNADAGLSVTMMGDFWSSEATATALDNAWFVSPDQGGLVSYENKLSTRNLRLVSGVSTLSACNDANASTSRYRKIADETVEDVKTGLMWRQCRAGSKGEACVDQASLALDARNMTEETLYAYVNAFNAAPSDLRSGYSDWRIPNVKELASLVDRCAVSPPSINSLFFPNNASISYISATRDANNLTRAWYVDFAEGTVAITPEYNKALRLVRAGQ